jgi:hypothetical protein
MAAMEPAGDQRDDGSLFLGRLTCGDADLCEQPEMAALYYGPLCTFQEAETASDLHASNRRDLTHRLLTRK